MTEIQQFYKIEDPENSLQHFYCKGGRYKIDTARYRDIL